MGPAQFVGRQTLATTSMGKEHKDVRQLQFNLELTAPASHLIMCPAAADLPLSCSVKLSKLG